MLSERQRLIITRYLLKVYKNKLKSVEEKYQYLSSINISSPKRNKPFPFNLIKESFLEKETSKMKKILLREKEEVTKEYEEISNIIYLLKNFLTENENKNRKESVINLIRDIELLDKEEIQNILNEAWIDYLNEQQNEILSAFSLYVNSIKVRSWGEKRWLNW